ncbi:META domain-containing protein [Allomuricauda sp. d1]|uniref:META domain-containing protein n=1 Tax=Allomuricauda sp. d1 TaxID=3136725 RepID=UPI0031D7B3F2
MKDQVSLYLLSATALFLSMGCGGTNTEKNLQGGNLENTSWKLTEFPDHDAKHIEVTLNFEHDELHGKGICNNYFSSYTASSNKLELGAVGATRKMCASDAKLEIDYFDQLSNVNQYGIVGDTLLLKTPKGFLTFTKMAKTPKPLVLKENTLGELPLRSSIDSLKKGLKILFPKDTILRKTEPLENGTHEVLQVGSDVQSLKGVLDDNVNQLKSLEILATDIQDQYGVQVGMALETVKSLRPNIEIATSPHFHTYASVQGSKIAYEICCNTHGPDKTNWSIEEVKNWKIKSIIWQKK